MKNPKTNGKPAGNELPGELSLLARIRARGAGLSHPGLSLGIGDDCALLRSRKGEELAVTTDLSIEGRHFRLDWHPPESVGHRTLARGLSDLAAMGAKPVAAFLSLGLPRNLTVASKGSAPWVDRFFDGLLALAQKHNVPLAGGDLAESPLPIADIVLTGRVKQGRSLLRSGAQPGDRIYVTGTLGGAALELEKLENSPANFAKHTQDISKSETHPHLYPQPRLAQGLWLSKHRLASAAIDLSDGISTDLAHLCEASGVAAILDAAALPISPGATRSMALHGGEDYELLFTAARAAKIPRTIAGVSITKIGEVRKPKANRPTVSILIDSTEQPLERSGWEHFADA